jgi:HupE / UreJ protein
MSSQLKAQPFARAQRLAPRLLTLLLGLMTLLFWQPAQAHLMVAQRGTLNIVGTGGFVVMALPVDSLSGVDDDGDGLLSLDEMRRHAPQIELQVQRGLQLLGEDGPRPLQAVMLNLSPDDDNSPGPARQLVVLGRFALADADLAALSRLQLRFTLFGKAAASQQQTVTVTQGEHKQVMVLKPGREQGGLLPSAGALLQEYATLGAEHVLLGLDHMLFLLVVLATGWTWRHTVLALTCFTMGHALTLAATALGGFVVPSQLVEPAIAATIVGMVVFDRWSAARRVPLSSAWRLALVFGCALIHGLGLSTALNIEGLDQGQRLLSLAGFNLGIEAAQVAVAVLAALMLTGISRLHGAGTREKAARFASLTALVAGSAWLVERTLLA